MLKSAENPKTKHTHRCVTPTQGDLHIFEVSKWMAARTETHSIKSLSKARNRFEMGSQKSWGQLSLKLDCDETIASIALEQVVARKHGLEIEVIHKVDDC